MAQGAFDEALNELRMVITRIVCAIENGGGEVNLRDLRLRLIDLTVLIERNPGITAAAEDLFAVAAAMVNEKSLTSKRDARKCRLMRDVRQRFDERLKEARPARWSPADTWHALPQAA
jgi:hypothetical protein